MRIISFQSKILKVYLLLPAWLLFRSAHSVGLQSAWWFTKASLPWQRSNYIVSPQATTLQLLQAATVWSTSQSIGHHFLSFQSVGQLLQIGFFLRRNTMQILSSLPHAYILWYPAPPLGYLNCFEFQFFAPPSLCYCCQLFSSSQSLK